jgi:transposase
MKRMRDPLTADLSWSRLHSHVRYKRLEDGKFRWPRIDDGVMKLSPAQLSALFEGLDWSKVRAVRHQRPQAVQ